MELKQRIAAFVQLGKFMGEFAQKQEWRGYQNGVSQLDFDTFNELISKVHLYNGWFTEENVRKALGEWAKALEEKNLEKWLSAYPEIQNENRPQRTVAIIMAGNIPLVGFHDLLCVLISGHRVLVKFSSDDDRLMPSLLDYFVKNIAPDFKNAIRIAQGKMEQFDAVIATGSDNSSRYFDQYFSAYPHIIRKNRTSVAVLNGDESREELEALGHDIFDYFGLGCRNVSKLFIPENFDLDRFFGAVFSFSDVINHKKYANNYDYHKAILLMNSEQLLENGFLLVKEDRTLHSPLGVLYIERYSNEDRIQEFLHEYRDKLQCVVGRKHIPFGQSQSPQLWDYADNTDTLSFLLKLN